VSFIADQFDGAAATARSYVQNGHLPCALVAVADRERVLDIRAFNEAAEVDSEIHCRIFALASITKPIVAVGVARLVDQGVLDYSDLIVEHLPELGVAEWRNKITIGDIFTHTTGLSAKGLPDLIELPASSSVDRLFDAEPAYEPCTEMQYATLTYQLINAIVRKRLGLSMSDFLQQYVYEPCGMEDTAYLPVAPERVMPTVDHPMDTAEKLRRFGECEVSGAGLWSSAADLIKLAQSVLEPDKLMSAETYRRHTESQPRLPRVGEDTLSWRTFGWCREEQACFPHKPDTGFYHGGATGTLLWVDPERSLIFVFLTSRWGSGNDHAFEALSLLYNSD